MDFIFLVADDLSLFIYSVLIFLVLKEFVPLRFKNRILHLVEILCMLVGCNAIVYPEEVTGTVGSLLVLMPILFLFHKSKWYMKVTTAFIVYPAMMALAFLFQDIGQQIWENVFQKQMSDEAQTALFVFTRFLKAPAWYLIYRCVKVWVPRAVRMLTRRMWSVLAVISLSSFIGIIITIYQCSAEKSYLAWPSCVAVLVTSMGCCYLCTCMAKIVRSDMERETMQYQKSYYQEIESSQQTVRRMRHDMKNHLGVVETLLRDGQYGMAEDYLHSMDQALASRTKVYCQVPVVNAVLSAKMQRAEEEGISCECQVDLKEIPSVDDMDLCVLFANTLDNAIEACGKMKERQKRRISVKARCMGGQFSYVIVNSKENTVKEKDGALETDKEDPGSHGIGLRSVRSMVEKYGGVMDVRYTDEEFSVTVCLPV